MRELRELLGLNRASFARIVGIPQTKLARHELRRVPWAAKDLELMVVRADYRFEEIRESMLDTLATLRSNAKEDDN